MTMRPINASRAVRQLQLPVDLAPGARVPGTDPRAEAVVAGDGAMGDSGLHKQEACDWDR